MVYEVILPKLGQTVEESRIDQWMKEEGDVVAKGDVLFTVETDKAVLEVESTKKGYLRKIIGREGEIHPVLSVVGLITRTPDEPLDDTGSVDGTSTESRSVSGTLTSSSESVDALSSDPVSVSETPSAVSVPPVHPAGERILASPRAKKVARECNVDLAFVTGTGPNGRIVEKDVIAYADAAPKATPVAQHVAENLGMDLTAVTGTGPQGKITKADVLGNASRGVDVSSTSSQEPVTETVTLPATTGQKLEGVRAIIAQRMHDSHQITAPVTLTAEVDATDFVSLREQLKTHLAEELGFNIGYNDLLMVVAARALRKFPYVNARLDGDVITYLDVVNVGLAVDTDRGLLVPNVKDVDRKSLTEVAKDIRAMVGRAGTGRSALDELTGGTFTITNLGMVDIDGFTPIINYPETAILGVGRIKDVPAVYKGEIVPRKHMWLSLTFDHRLVDGAPAAKFLQYIKQLVEQPYLLLI